MVCVLSQSTLLRLQIALQKLSKSGPALRALPRSKPLRFRFSGTPQRRRLGWACIFCPSPVRATQVTRCLVSAHSPGGVGHLITSLVPASRFPGCAVGAPSQLCPVSPLGSWSLAVILLADVNHPGSQEDSVSNWEPARSLVEDAISRAELPLAFWLWLLPACLPASRRGWAGLLLASSPLVFTQSFVLWAGQQCLRLELFEGKFSLSLSFLFFSVSVSLAIPQFGLLSHISSLRLSSGHSGPVLTLSNAARTSLFNALLPVVDVSIWATFPLGVAVRRIICGFYLFTFFLLMLPSVIPKLPTNPPVRGFPGVWKLILFYDSLPRMVSFPNSFVSLFIFYILSYLLLKTMGCLSGCLVSPTRVQKLFCGICSAFKWSFDEFVGEKVVSPSYSSAILGRPLCTIFSIFIFLSGCLGWEAQMCALWWPRWVGWRGDGRKFQEGGDICVHI